MSEKKEAFLLTEFIPLMRKLNPDERNRWGVMNAQQMVEHFSETVRMANGRLILPVHTKEEDLPKMRAFMLSERPFRENTKNPILSDIPESLRNKSIEAAVDELQHEMSIFFQVFKDDCHQLTVNPIFGYLNYEENVHLLYKHAMHHLRQFGLIE